MRAAAFLGALVIVALVTLGMWTDERVAEIDRGMVDNTFSGETLRDWKDLADHVALVTVADERPIVPEGATGPFGTLRRVWLSVDRVLWSAPHAPTLPPVLSTRTYGWADEDLEVEMREEGAARWELHRQYVAPLVLHDEDPGRPSEWAPLTDSSIMPVQKGRVNGARVHAGEARRRLHASSVDEVQRMVKAEPAHPLADRHRRLRPRRRMEVMARKGAYRDPQP